MNTNDDILDAALTLDSKKKKVKFKAFVALAILWIGFVSKAKYGLNIDTNNVIIVITLFCATILTFFNQGLGVRMTFLLLLLGVFRVLTFFNWSYSIGFGIASMSLWIEVYILAIFSVHFLLFRSAFLSMKGELISSILGEQNHSHNQKIENRFITRFSGKDSNELNKIILDENMSDEAKEAAKHLLNKICS